MNEKSINNKVIILGGSHHNTLGVVRSLGEKAILSYVLIVSINTSDSLVLKSKYVLKGWILKTYSEAIQFIVDKFSNEEEKPILIATSDDAISSLDIHYDKLIQNFHLPNGRKEGNLTYLMNKEVMGNVAKEMGLNVAKTWIMENKIIPNGIEYPCITKPISSISGSKALIKVSKIQNDLIEYAKGLKQDIRIQIQQYIDREFEYQLIGCSVNGGETVIIPGYTEIIRSSEITNTGFLKYLPINNLVFDFDKCKAFIKACNFSGLFSLEFIRGKDGKDYFLEINFRNDGNAYAVTAAGINLPYIWVLSSVGLQYNTELDYLIKPILVMPELVDIYQVFYGKITLKNWINDIKKTDCFIYYNKKDKAPFYFELRKLLFHSLRRFPMFVINKIKR